MDGGGAAVAVQRFHQPKYVDALRWLPPSSPFHRHVVASLYDFDSDSSSIDIFSLHATASTTITNSGARSLTNLDVVSSSPSSGRFSILRVSPSRNTHKPIVAAASSSSGSLNFFVVDSVEPTLEAELSLSPSDGPFHNGGIAGMDLEEGRCEAITVGEDGRVNIAWIGQAGGVNHRRVFDSGGLVSYSAVCWASPAEFVTGGPGFNLQWWDQRKPGGPVSHSTGKWIRGTSPGMVHSVDIHPSRKHICVAGASSGAVFAWDLRQPQQPISLSGMGPGGIMTQSLSESEVWEVQYDPYIQSINLSASTVQIPPVMMCSEDGVLAVVEAGESPIELLSEPCAINAFEIDPHNPSAVVCSLEWETIAVLTRP
ncbi:Nuclear pore complex protein [Nymphaea thermarum]|nr:Nuclear pore complex protein [Nymphaea thermarum]